ncbi:MAG: MMPL family transporter [candidate division WOR-3 bacterium]|nr:MMPL family transporter [candidate division WOR-3 bacterium]
MQKFANLVIKYRIIIIVSTVALTGLLGYQLKNLKIDTDIQRYLPQDDPEVILFNEVGDEFGGTTLAMVALETDNVFNYKTLKRIDKITEEFNQMDEISQVISLTDIIDIKKIEWGVEVGKLIDKNNIPKDPADLKKLREYTLSKDTYKGSLVSNDGAITVIIARLRKDADKIKVAHKLREIVKTTKGNEKIYYGGIPFQMASVLGFILKDLHRLIPLVTMLVMFTLFFSFRTLRGVFLPLSCVLMGTVWTVGIMALMKIPLTVASDAVPVLLIAIGSAYGIHMLSKYNEDIQLGDNKIQGIKDALSEVGIPIFLAGITTLIGFLTFLFSDLSLIRETGIFAAVGVMFAMLISVTFLPAVLSFLRVGKVKLNHKGVEDSSLTRLMDKLGRFVLRSEKLIVGIGIAIILASLIAIPRIHREVNMVEYFKKDSEIRQSEEMMEEKLGGSIPIQLLVKGDLKDPFVLKEILKLEKYLEAQPNVNDPQSIADLICEINGVMNDHYTIPETKEGVANLWLFIEGNEVLNQLINNKATEGLIQAKLGTVSTGEVRILVDAIENYLKKELKTDLLKVKISLASADLALKLRRKRAEEILSKIKWDIEMRNSAFPASDTTLTKVIISGMQSGEEKFDDVSMKKLERRITDYFKSDEADIQIESERIIAKIVANVLIQLKRGKSGEKEIIGILKKNIPKKSYAGEPEALKYTAESIMAIITDFREWIKVNNLVQSLNPFLPENLKDDRDFLEDLRDNCWEINEDWLAIDATRYMQYDSSVKHQASGVKLTAVQTGMPIIYMDIDKKIMRSQALSLSIALFLVFLLLSFQLRSLIGGLISISPIILTILINFILMAVFDIPLDVITVMIGSVAVGIGIDYTIHFINRFKSEFEKSKSELEALDKTLETTGKAILINAISVMMGFLVLVLGSIVPIQRFGYLIAFTMITSALGAITFLPAMILITKAGFIGDFGHLANKLKRKATKSNH